MKFSIGLSQTKPHEVVEFRQRGERLKSKFQEEDEKANESKRGKEVSKYTLQTNYDEIFSQQIHWFDVWFAAAAAAS